MTRNSDKLVEVKVSLQTHPANALKTLFISHVVEDGSLADLRAVLLRDGVIHANDSSLFRLPEGRIVGKSSEDHFQWRTLLQDDEISVVRMPLPTIHPDDSLSVTAAPEADEDASSTNTSTNDISLRNLDQLRLSERLLLTRNSKLGEGVNVHEDHGPQYSGHSAIADIDLSAIRFLHTKDAQHEITVTSSARTAAYIVAGWTISAINSTEFARDGRGRRRSTAFVGLGSYSTTWVTGRYVPLSCQLSLPGAHMLKPHPELQAAVDRALAEEDLSRRAQKLDAVWHCYGDVYVDSVEMGGMCHLTSAVGSSEQIDRDTLYAEMERTLYKKFESQAESQVAETMFENQYFHRVGGLEHAEDLIQWKSGLAQPASWAMTRTLRVVPVINLFDESTQNRILAASHNPSVFKVYVFGMLHNLGTTVYAGVSRVRLRLHSLYNDENLRAQIPLLVNVMFRIHRIFLVPLPPDV